ncbi:MAG TPA: rhomboid family intramembrane serine protease [Solirubrobacteraceae bacterium]|jgi:membrane associated rhomboid family serine protease|nr:rhomboid family intramembrane serine protease [Solirubrobacteraceae bacterium]
MTAKPPLRTRAKLQIGGLQLLAVIVVFMWVIEAINSIDNQALDGDGGIYPHNVGRLWAVLTSPFLHVSFQHLESNTVPFVFMGFIIALEGARRLATATLIILLVAGFGAWVIAPSHELIVGASGIVFGYATYLFTRGLFNRSLLELVVGGVVGLFWGGALLTSIVPHYGISWQDHAAGAVGGVVAAAVLARDRKPAGRVGRRPGGVELPARP